jgi:hypothetical protein
MRKFVAEWYQNSIAVEAQKMILGNLYIRKHRWDVSMAEVLQIFPREEGPNDGTSSYIGTT